jgi:putative transcriptional regulator
LRDIAAGRGPVERILALGYAGWAAGQLEAEIESNSWISVPSSRELIFGTENEDKWNKAAQSQGIDIRKLTSEAGHA